MSQTVKGPLNPANIDSVTRNDHDHRQLWDSANQMFGSHDARIAALEAQIAALIKTAESK